MRRLYIPIVLFVILPFFSIPELSLGSELSLIKSLQETLQKSREILKRAEGRLRSGYWSDAELSELRGLLEEIRACDLLLQGRFRARERELRGIGEKALSRHQAMAEGVSQALLDYIALMEGLTPDRPPPLSRVEQLLSLLQTILPVRQKPILGTLPYKHLRYPAKEPDEAPSIRPAYRGGDRVVRPEDLKSTSEAPISYEIAMLAQSLNWNPVSIYEWVKNNVETEWYWGSMKGAEETLRQRRGNDADQASLLIALLRASGYPARYVRGVIEFFPDLERAKNLFGIDDPQGIAQYLQKAGIPFKAILSGGRITNLQMEHIWVETRVPYANYRGAILDEHGKAWLGLDTSIKVTGYAYNTPGETPANLSLSNLRDQYLRDYQSQTPLEYLKTYINFRLKDHPQPITYEDLLWTRTLIPEVMNILPASLQFRQIRITHEYPELPEELRHRVRFRAASGPNQELFDITLNASELSNQKIVLTYEPESREDQEIIHSYGGLDNTPAYLVRLRPFLTVNGERVAVGKEGLPMGREYELLLELISPNGVERITNLHLTGNLSVIGIVSQNASLINETPSPHPSSSAGEGRAEGEKNAEHLLYEEAIRYIDRWNKAEEELASLLRLRLTRPIPTVVTLGGVIDVTHLLDTPHGFEWKGLYVDSDLRAVETVRSSESARLPDGQGVWSENQRLFMELSSLQGSVLENRLFEEDFGVESISTAKLFGLARNTQPATEILTLNKTNIGAILPTFPFDENMKEDIQNSINQNLTIRIPRSEIDYEDWTGVGYLKENPETGESGYMLSGMIAGGMTVWEKGKWQSLSDILRYPYTEPSNQDPLSAREIKKLPGGDLQIGFVGELLPRPLQVKVTDSAGKGVENAEVIFRVKAGGGRLIDLETKVREEHVSIIKKTNKSGIAGVLLRLGNKTSESPAFLKIDPADRYYSQVGENIVEVTLKSSGIKTLKPFTAYGKPGEVKNIEIHNLGNPKGDILSYVGPVSIILSDQEGNPVANQPVDFIPVGIERLSTCEEESGDNRPALLFTWELPCAKRPLYGCGEKDGQKGILTDSAGSAVVGIILGSIPDANYHFKARYRNFELDFFRTSHPFGNCRGDAHPAVKLQLDSYYLADAYGHNLNAARSGKTIPLEAMIYFLREEETIKRETIHCEDKSIVCDKVLGKQTYKHEIDSSRSWVWFGDVPGAPLGGGVFRTDYKLKPGINSIPIKGTGEASVKRTIPCPNCITSITTVTLNQNLLALAYGVDITIDPLPPVLMDRVDQEGKGHLASDLTIRYTIHPSQYTALSAYVDLIEDGEVIGRVATERSGTGSATFSQGFPFSLNRTYEIQVVLNPGTGVEIKSDKKKLTVARLSVLQDTPSYPEVSEIGYGDGSHSERRYRIQIRSRTYAESCPSGGMIRVVDRKGETIVSPSRTDYYLPEYALEFTRALGHCQVKILDPTAAGRVAKEKFILSNRPRQSFNDRAELLEDITVLYGGMGNILEIEIDGMRKQWPIEPVGIVLIGIDGLRQDVLYSGEKDSVKDGGKYNIEIKDLPGIREILAGYNRPEEEQRYILLPEVTAIFPSITLASWASIFTGKLPNETGIVGNEFFDRINRRVITFSDGAFKGMSILDRFPKPNLKATSGIGAADKTLSKEVKTVYEEIKAIKSDLRTVAIMHNYSRGADEWRYQESLIDKLRLAWNYYGSDEAEIAELMDSSPAEDSVQYILRLPLEKKRFPILFAVYFAGLDHWAHHLGMATYGQFIKEYTDKGIAKIVQALKSTGQFDNKIFILVSDHGMTEMPTFGKITLYSGTKDEREVNPDNSCELKVDKFNKREVQDSEKTNNNLHIWELAEVLKAVGEENAEKNEWRFKVLAPREIADLYKIKDERTKKRSALSFGATGNMGYADIIVGLNGPMAHVYIPNLEAIGRVAELFRLSFQGSYPGEASRWWGMDELDYRYFREEKVGRLNSSIDKILVSVGDNYCVFHGLNNYGGIKCSGSDPFSYSGYVNAWERIRGLNHPTRSGDIILLFKDDTLGNPIDRYTSGIACKSWHGSLNRSDSYVPFIVAYPGGNRFEIDTVLQRETICKGEYSGCRGNWKLSEIVKELISSQVRQGD